MLYYGVIHLEKPLWLKRLLCVTAVGPGGQAGAFIIEGGVAGGGGRYRGSLRGAEQFDMLARSPAARHRVRSFLVRNAHIKFVGSGPPRWWPAWCSQHFSCEFNKLCQYAFALHASYLRRSLRNLTRRPLSGDAPPAAGDIEEEGD